MKLVALGTASVVALGIGSCGKDKEALPVSSPPMVPNWAEQQGFEGNDEAERGAEIFAQVGCLQCHTYLGTGSRNLGAPDLSEIGRESPRSPKQYASYVSEPQKFGNQVMPIYKDLGRRNLLALGEFLRVSKGER